MARLAKLDDDGNVIMESAVETVVVKVDGQEVEVPQGAADILQKAEHDLKSRNERALREGRESISASLHEDTQWYATHPDPELWKFYEPKVNGGKGFTGDQTMLTAKPEVKEPQGAVAAKQDDAEVAALKEQLRQQGEQIAAIMGRQGKTEEMKVVEVRDAALRRYPDANPKAVLAELRSFFSENNRHPNATEVETIVRENHEFVAAKLTAQKTELTTPKPNIPVVTGGGTPPNISNAKTPRLDDIDAWKNLAIADNVTPG